MAIPDFQTLMRPLLEGVATHPQTDLNTLTVAIGQQFRLTPAELTELLSSRRQTRFANRCSWAISHLVQAGLVTRPLRGKLAATERGRALLKENDEPINMKRLMIFPEYRIFRGQSGDEPLLGHSTIITAQASSETSPDEVMRTASEQHRSAVAGDLLDALKKITPEALEVVALDLLVKLGYGRNNKSIRHLGGSGDAGIDGIVTLDKLGLDSVYIQAKLWDRPVGRPEVQRFVGALLSDKRAKGVFVTTSTFTAEAIDFARTSGIALVDGPTLASLMIESGLGVHEEAIYKAYSLDSDYLDRKMPVGGTESTGIPVQAAAVSGA